MSISFERKILFRTFNYLVPILFGPFHKSHVLSSHPRRVSVSKNFYGALSLLWYMEDPKDLEGVIRIKLGKRYHFWLKNGLVHYHSDSTEYNYYFDPELGRWILEV